MYILIGLGCHYLHKPHPFTASSWLVTVMLARLRHLSRMRSSHFHSQPKPSSAFKGFDTNYEEQITTDDTILIVIPDTMVPTLWLAHVKCGIQPGSCALPTFTQPTPFFKVFNLSLQLWSVHLKGVDLSPTSDYHNRSYGTPPMHHQHAHSPLSPSLLAQTSHWIRRIS